MLGNDTRLVMLRHSRRGTKVFISRFHNEEVRCHREYDSQTSVLTESSLNRLTDVIDHGKAHLATVLLRVDSATYFFHLPPNPAALKKDTGNG